MTNTTTITTKGAMKSSTIRGGLVQVVGTVLIVAGVADSSIFGHLDNIVAGIGAILHLYGLARVYLGRKKANPDISLLGGKNVEVPK